MVPEPVSGGGGGAGRNRLGARTCPRRFVFVGDGPGHVRLPALFYAAASLALRLAGGPMGGHAVADTRRAGHSCRAWGHYRAFAGVPPSVGPGAAAGPA